MNTEMAYLLGMILGNGEIQRDNSETRITIDIPHKNLYTDDLKDVKVYAKEQKNSSCVEYVDKVLEKLK